MALDRSQRLPALGANVLTSLATAFLASGASRAVWYWLKRLATRRVRRSSESSCADAEVHKTLGAAAATLPAVPLQGSLGNSPRRADPTDPRPRSSYLPWDEYFMSVAVLSSLRSKDPNKQVGACIVSPEKVILGIGYNGFPRGCHDSQLPWAKKSLAGDPLDTKYPYVCHAEMNAIMNKNAASIHGAVMYVTLFPCNECAKLMIQAGIAEIVFLEGKIIAPEPGSPGSSSVASPDPCYAASMRLLEMAGIKCKQMKMRHEVHVTPIESRS